MFWGSTVLYVQCTRKCNSSGFSSPLIYMDFCYFKRIKEILKFEIQNQPKVIDTYGGTELTQWPSSALLALRCPFYCHTVGIPLCVGLSLLLCLTAPFGIPLLSLSLWLFSSFLPPCLSSYSLLYFDVLILACISSSYSLFLPLATLNLLFTSISMAPLCGASIFLLLSFLILFFFYLHCLNSFIPSVIIITFTFSFF